MAAHHWAPPRLHRAGHGEDRRVTWLELFYDLVYVAVLIQLGNTLSEDVTLGGFARFVVLFALIWWAWTGITFYMNRFVVDDLWHRLLIYLQIVAIALVGVSVEQAFGALHAQFALAYAAIRLLLVLLYVRTWRSEPATRPLTQRYVVSYLIGIGLWVLSAFVPMPWAAALWLAALAVEIGNIFLPRTRALQTLLPPHPHHMRERYGIFVIIVLGESFIKTISAASGMAVTGELLLYSLLGIFVVVALWWLYFDDVEATTIRPTHSAPYLWIYAHLPLALGLTAFGVASKKIFLAMGEDHIKSQYILLYGGALILYALALAVIELASQRERGPWRAAPMVWRLGLAAAFAVLVVVGQSLPPLAWVACAAAIMAVQVAGDVIGERRAAGLRGGQ